MNGPILAIDPGTTKSAIVGYAKDCGIDGMNVADNSSILNVIKCFGHKYDAVVCEMVACYGMEIGEHVLETVRWIGRFEQAASDESEFHVVYRKDIKMHLCGSMRAKDRNIRQALIDKLGPQGTKKNPGPTYGVKSHIWSALAVAVYYMETQTKGEK